MALHPFGNSVNEVVHNENPATSTNTNVDENNCPTEGQETSTNTQDLNPGVVDSNTPTHNMGQASPTPVGNSTSGSNPEIPVKEVANDTYQDRCQEQQGQENETLQEIPEKRISTVFPSLDDEGNPINPGSPVVLNHEDMAGAARASNALLNMIFDFVKNDVADEVVRDRLEKFFEGLNNKPFKKYIGTNGAGWYAIYRILLRCKREDMCSILHGLIFVQNIQEKSGLLMTSFNPDMLVETDPTLYQLTRRLYKLGDIFQDKSSGVSPDSNLDKMVEENLEALSEMTKEAVKEVSQVNIYTGGGYSESFDFWDVLKWGAVAAGVIGGGYLAYKGYQALTEDDPNDVVFIDMDDYDTDHPAFI